MRPFVSVIIPTYNNARTLSLVLIDAEHYLKSLQVPHEIIIVDASSVDATPEIAKRYAQLMGSVKYRQIDKNKNIGAAAKAGLKYAHGKWLVVLAPEAGVSLNEFGKALHHLENGADVALGSRSMSRSHSIGAGLQIVKKFSRLFHNLIIRAIAPTGIFDTGGGFVCLRSGVAKNILDKTKIDTAGWLIELLLIAKKDGLKIKEFPICVSESRKINFGYYRESLADTVAILKNKF